MIEIEALEALRNTHINDTYHGTRLSLILTDAINALHERAELKKQLSESQRGRGRRVEDMKRVGYALGACCVCKYTRDSDECNERNGAMPDDFDPFEGKPCTCFEWRGAQEDEK